MPLAPWSFHNDASFLVLTSVTTVRSVSLPLNPPPPPVPGSCRFWSAAKHRARECELLFCRPIQVRSARLLPLLASFQYLLVCCSSTRKYVYLSLTTKRFDQKKTTVGPRHTDNTQPLTHNKGRVPAYSISSRPNRWLQVRVLQRRDSIRNKRL